MKNKGGSHRMNKLLSLFLTAFILMGALAGAAFAAGVPGDNNPAIAVAAATENSVVGVATYRTVWTRQSGEQTSLIGQGSGVVIQEGYILTNNHVVDKGTNFKVLLTSGEYIEAVLVGTDASTDLAVLQVETDSLVPVKVGSSAELVVGSTAIAIGNPGGEVLANTVTSGIVSALERTTVNGGNTTRQISYIQHDAAINSGNSGGGLFNINGELVGINTLKYGGSVFTSVRFEGLGFAIPIDTAYPIAMDLIEYGYVRRPQLGVRFAAVDGPSEPMANYPPASVCLTEVIKDSPAERAGLRMYDFITEIDGVRVTNLMELTAQIDMHQAGDTVELTIVRYVNPEAFLAGPEQQEQYYMSPFEYFFGYGGYGGYSNDDDNNRKSTMERNRYDVLTVEVTLEIMEE